jgi:FixJ family two-component response regulator
MFDPSHTFQAQLCLQAAFVSEVPFGFFARKASSLPIVVMGKDTSQDQKLIGVHCGAVDFLEKPLSSLRLRNIWQHTVRKVR